MRVSEKGIAFLKRLEGYDPKCKIGDSWKAHYDTIADIYDMPYGITCDSEGRKVQKDSIWTNQYVDYVFEQMVRTFESRINKLLTVELTQAQYDAVFSFVWNIGIGNFSTSTALKRIKAKDFANVGNAMMLFDGVISRVKQKDGTIKKVKIPIQGIINRRKKEIALWEGGDYGDKGSTT